jgi:hypothetical protein
MIKSNDAYQAMDLVKKLMQALNTARENYVVLSADESERVAAWLESSFPIASWGRITWSKLPDGDCRSWANKWNDLPATFADLCNVFGLGEPEVVVLWTNALRPALRMSLGGVRRHAAQIFEMDWDTWIVCPSGGWCIEVYHEGEICFGKADRALTQQGC